MRDHLARRDVDPADAETVLAELKESGYVDDARFAQRFAEDRRALDGWGAQRIALRLRELGVGEEEVVAVAGEPDGEAELEGALAVLRRRYPQGVGDLPERQRALGALVRRGYELELAHEAVRAHGRQG